MPGEPVGPDERTPRCKGCGYVIAGLASPGHCPECGDTFDLHDPRSFTLKLPFLRWLYWFPALVMAVLGGTLLVAVLVFGMGSWGFALWTGVPFAAGSLLGYNSRARAVVLPLLSLVLLLGLILGVASLNLAGVFCGATLGAIFVGPIVIGAVAGALLREALKRTRFSQRDHLVSLLLLLLPVGAAWVEGPPPAHRAESVETSAVLTASPAEAWNAIVFYEEVTHEPPLILRVGLARPLRTIGASAAPGDVKVCLYNKGRITKRVVEAVPGRVLAFEVVEQRIGYEREVRLVGGRFLVEPAPGGARVTLRTEYEPRLSPRWMWRPFEEIAVHTLHGHVLEGMAREAERRRAVARAGGAAP